MCRVALVIDAANVVGSRPDGWWRDRPGAASRLVSGLASAMSTGALDGPVVVVLEGAARAGVPVGPVPAPADSPTGPSAPTAPADADAPAGPADLTAPVAQASERGLRVVHADRDGDSTIVAEVAALVAAGTEPVVVTADRALRDRVIAAGGTVLGPSWLRARLP